MKKFLTVLLTFVISFMQITYVYAAVPQLPTQIDGGIEGEISLPADDLKKGDMVYINIGITDVASLYAFESVIEYDDEFLEYKDIKINEKSEEDIFVTECNLGQLKTIYSKKGEREIDKSKEVCTVEFLSKKGGETNIKLKSLKIVFDDMTYYSNIDINKSVDITIKTKTKPQKPTSGGGGGGSRPSGGGGVSVSGGGVTASGTETPVKPEIPNETDGVKDKNLTDVKEGFWAYKAISTLTKSGIINGFDDGTYKPEKNITRGEFVKIIVQGEVTEGVENDFEFRFNDVDTQEWFYKYVMKAAEIGLVNGDENGYFMPESNITREEAAVIMKRYADYKNNPLIPIRMNINFADESEISDFAVGSVDALYVSGIMNGSDNGMFYPKAAITRAEAAQGIYNLLTVIGGFEV